MLMYSWMKFVELAPERYDFAVTVMTAGRLNRIKDEIAAAVSAGERLLDIGCGTGTLALRCLRRGADVTGLDMSAYMLEQARKNADLQGFGSRLELIKDSVTQLHKHFGAESFDVITCTMVLGEFPPAYLDYVLRHCLRILRPGGRLIIADEVWPESRAGRLVYHVAMALAWIPQFLLLRRVTYPVADLPGLIRNAGFEVLSKRTWPGSSFVLITASRPHTEIAPMETRVRHEVTL